MNIGKSLEIVKGKLLMIKKLLKNDEENGHSSSYEMQKEDFEAIETLLTAYEKEKEKNKEITIKNNSIKNESNAYGEEIVRLDNQLKAKNQEIEYLNCIIESDKDNYINKNKIKPIQIIDLDGKIHNVYKIEEE